MYPMTRMRLDHLAHLLIATNRTQLHIRQPLPRRTLLLQIIQETFRAGHEWSILAVRAQTHVDAIQVAFARNARKCGNHELNQTRIRLVLRKSTRLNSSHVEISYAVFCLKKKKKKKTQHERNKRKQ